MERALYLCPRCRCLGTLRTEGNRIFCDCGLTLEYTESCYFSPRDPFSTLAEWDDWQREQLHQRAFPHDSESGMLFSDGGVTLSRVRAGHKEELLGVGGLFLYEDRLVCADRCFPLKRISNMADVLANRLLLTVDGEYYEIRSQQSVSLRKYLEVWREC